MNILTAKNTTGGEAIVIRQDSAGGEVPIRTSGFAIPDLEPIPYVSNYTPGAISRKPKQPNTGFKIGSYNSRSKNKRK